jgi:hypothetical protein
MITTATSNQPTALSPTERKEIVSLPEFREAWGVTDETVEELMPRLYGVRFDFVSGGPGYVGPLYLIYGDAISGQPLVVIREDSGLAVVVD